MNCARAPGCVRHALLGVVDVVGRAMIDFLHAVDHHVELALRVVAERGHDEPQVDRGVAAIADDGEQDVVALLGPARTAFDRLDPLIEDLLVGPEHRRRLGGDELALSTGDPRQAQMLPQVALLHDIGEVAEDVDQFGHVDELGEPRDGFVSGRRAAIRVRSAHRRSWRPSHRNAGSHARQQLLREIALQRVELTHRVGDRRPTRHDQRAAGIDRIDESGL